MKNIAIWADNESVNFSGEKEECAKVAQTLDKLGGCVRAFKVASNARRTHLVR